MQNKALVYGVGAAAVLIVAAGAWMLVGKSDMPGMGDSMQGAQTQTTTLKGLMAMRNPQKCTFSSVTAQTNSSGTVYIAGGEMRGDFTTLVAGQTTESHMIVKENTSYVWTSASPQGFKMSFDAMATQGDANPQPTVDPNANVEYSCAAWSSDASLFALPSNITFQDMSSLIPNGNSGAGANGSVQGGMSSQCAACDQAPDAATKAQCRAALQCN